MGQDRSHHWTPDEFRAHGHEVVEWVARYMEEVEELPVQTSVAPGWVREQLPPSPPVAAEGFADVLADLDRVVVPALTHWQHPGWFAYFPTGASGPSILADLVSSGLGVQGMLWSGTEERRGGKGCVGTWIYRGWPDNLK